MRSLRKSSSLLLWLLTALMAVACSDDDFMMNDSFAKSDSYAEMSDATPLKLSTFRLDSVMTSGQKTLWVGKTFRLGNRKKNDPTPIGTMHSETYFRVAEPVMNGVISGYGWLRGKEHYDSCTVVLYHTGQWVGDTTQVFDIQVKRLTQRLEFADEHESAFYNVRSFATEDDPVGHFIFKPRPVTRPRLRFRLDDSYGLAVRDFIISTNNLKQDMVRQTFEDFFKGFQISCRETSHNCDALLAFNADSVRLTLHSHLADMQGTKLERIFALTDANKQFNHVWNDGIAPAFQPLTQRYKQVEEAADNDFHSLIYEGLGYYTRINFPNLDNLKNQYAYQHIVKAVLRLYVEEESYDKYKIPSSFYFFEVNKGNVIQSQVKASSGAPTQGHLVYNPYDRRKMYYEADLTYYINTLLSQQSYDENTGLVITWGNGMSPTNYDYMLFKGRGTDDITRSELDITFYYYDVEVR